MPTTTWTNDAGGTLDWNTASNWSSGVPDSSTDAVFDAASFSADGTIITFSALAQCKSIITTAADQTFTISSSVYSLEVYGSTTLSNKLTVTFTGTAYWYNKSTGSETITQGSATLTLNRTYFDGSGGSWTNQDAFTITGSILLKNGTWDTNGQTVTTTGSFYTAVGTKTLTLGASSFTCADWNNDEDTNFTLNGGTSIITLTDNVFTGGGQTYYELISTYDGTVTISGVNTFTNLTKTGGTAITNVLSLSANQTITGTLTLSGNNATNYRMLVQSNVAVTRRTLTSANNSITNCDFLAITGAGAASWDFSLVEMGDCGNNSGITFRAGEDRYYFSGTGNFHDGKWYDTTGGGGSAVGMPLPQDNAIFDANSFSGSATVTISNTRIGSIDMSAVDEAVGLTISNHYFCFGNYVLGSNITLSGSYHLNLYGNSNYSFNPYGNTLDDIIVQTSSISNTYTVNSSFTCKSLTVGRCTYDQNDYNITLTGAFGAGGNYGQTVRMGNGTWEFTGAALALAMFYYIYGTLTCENSTVKINPTAGSGDVRLYLGGRTLYNLWITESGTSTKTPRIYISSGTFTCNNLKIDAGCVCKIDDGKTVNLTSLTAIGSAGNLVTIMSTSSTSAHTLSIASGMVVCDYLDLSYSTATGGATFYAGANSTNSGNNTGWSFTNAPVRYLIGTGARNTNDTANWSLWSGGAGGYPVPTSADSMYFDANSGTGTVTINANLECDDFTCSGISAITLSASVYTLSLYGSFTGHSNLTITFTGTSYLYFKSTGAETITQGSATLTLNRLHFNGSGGTWTLQDTFSIGSSTLLGILDGTLDTNGQTVTCNYIFGGTGTNTLTLGASTINLTSLRLDIGGLDTLNCGTSTINFTDIFQGTSKTYYNVAQSGDGSSYIAGANTFTNLNITGYNSITSYLYFTNNQTITGTLTITGNNATNYRLLIHSDTLGTQRTLTSANNVITNCDFRDIKGAGAGSWDFSGSEIGDCGGNAGITFRTGENRYYFSGTGNYHDAKWYDTTGGGGSAVGMPLPQDTAVFDANSFSDTSTVKLANQRYGSIDMSAVDSAVTLTKSVDLAEYYGDFIINNNVTISGSSRMTFYGVGNYTLNVNGQSLYGVYFHRGSCTLAGDVLTATNSSGVFYCFSMSSVDLNDYNVTTGKFTVNTSGTVLLGNGTITTNLAAASGDDSFTYTLGTLNSEGSTIKIIGNHATANIFAGGSQTYNNLWITNLGTGTVVNITGANTFNNIKIDAGRTVKFKAGTTTNFASLTAWGASGSLITITSATAATHTLNYTGTAPIECQYLDISYSTVNQVAKLYAGATSTNSGNNTNWIFGNFLRPVINFF